MKNTVFLLIKRMLLYARAYWVHIALIFILNLLTTPISLLKPLAMKMLIDSGFGSHPLPDFITYFFPSDFEYTFSVISLVSALFFIGVVLFDNINGSILWLLSTYTGERLVRNFRTLVFNHVQGLSLAYHDRKGSSDSLYRIQWDTMSIRAFLLGQVSPLISSILTLVSMIIIMFTISWQFAIIALSVVPPLFLLIRVSAKRQRSHWYKVKDSESKAISVIHEVLGSLRVVKAFGQEQNESSRFINRSDIAERGQLKVAKIAASFQFVISMVFASGTALFIYFGAQYVNQGTMTLGELTLMLAYLGQIFGPLQTISKNIHDVQSSIAGIERVFAILDEEMEVEEKPDARHLDRSNGSFEFRKVSFAYTKEVPTLENVSFKINSGDRVGIMGTTGAGKSTLVSLLTRFYDATSGTILIDGVDIRDYKLADYRKQFSIVLQEPVLFSTTIGENIRYGRPDASEEEVINAAKAANAHDFIMKSKEGYDTPVGERGMQLSGGERQRVAMARAFLKDAPVLILDEPTSSLDVKTEARIMEAIERLMLGRTTFMITHRLDSLNSCNIILHLEKGNLVEIVENNHADFIEEKKKNLLNDILK